MKECPNKRVLIIREDGEYDSASDFDEDTYASLGAHEDDDTRPEQEEEHVTADDADKYMSLISHVYLVLRLSKQRRINVTTSSASKESSRSVPFA